MAGSEPLAIADIMAWCALAGMVDPSDRMGFLRCMQAMDSAYMSEMAKKRAKAERKQR